MDIFKNYDFKIGYTSEQEKFIQDFEARIEKLKVEDPGGYAHIENLRTNYKRKDKRMYRIADALSLKHWRDIYMQHNSAKAVMNAVYLCSKNNFKLPKWCREAFVTFFDKIMSGEARSWDDCLGPLYPKGAHIDSQRKIVDYGLLVYRRINILNSAGKALGRRRNPNAIDGALFERVGRELGIGGKTVTEKIYYITKKVVEDTRALYKGKIRLEFLFK